MQSLPCSDSVMSVRLVSLDLLLSAVLEGGIETSGDLTRGRERRGGAGDRRERQTRGERQRRRRGG